MTHQIDMYNDRPLPMLVQRACQLLIAHQPEGAYFGCFSGGKDSVVIKELARLAGVRVDWHYHVTTIDPPELVRFIKRHHPDVIWDKPRHGSLIQRAANKKGFPTRKNRWCCDEYKEILGPKGCVKIIGVRVAESAARRARYKKCVTDSSAGRKNVMPVRLWSDANVWQFIRESGIPYCSLYDEGFKRLGCVGCPSASASSVRREFDRWPGFEKAWRWAFRRLWQRRYGTSLNNGRPWFGSIYFSGPDEMFDWWVSGKSLPKSDGMFPRVLP